MIAAILPAVVGLIGKAVDKAIPDRDKAEAIKADVTLALLNQGSEELRGAVEIIKAEAQGESWLQRNWRPGLMVWFAGLIGAHWLGYTPDNLPAETVAQLLDIVQVGVGGYVIGRTVEKAAKVWKGGA